MNQKFKILGINGSASENSSNLGLLNLIGTMGGDCIELNILDDLSNLPHFNTKFTNGNLPASIISLHDKIMSADGIIISTPEYVFSIPSRLKNLLEWCVAETILTDKPVGLITASANGIKGHEELLLIMKTLQSKCTDECSLLIQGIKGKFNDSGEILDRELIEQLHHFHEAFYKFVLACKEQVV